MTDIEKQIETLGDIVAGGFARMDKGFAAIAEDIAELREEVTEIRSAMVTKTDYHALRQEMRDGFASLRGEIRDIRDELEELRGDVGNLTGFRKEIDHALERIAAIEKHLGLERKIAA